MVSGPAGSMFIRHGLRCRQALDSDVGPVTPSSELAPEGLPTHSSSSLVGDSVRNEDTVPVKHQHTASAHRRHPAWAAAHVHLTKLQKIRTKTQTEVAFLAPLAVQKLPFKVQGKDDTLSGLCSNESAI